MPTKAERRRTKRIEAAAVLERHTGPVMSMLADVVGDLADEVAGLKQFQADAAVAAELAYRLDQAIPFSDPLAEALDGIVTFFVALAAVGIYRAVCRSEKLRGAKVDSLRSRLESRGPKMAKSARARLKRRVKRLESR